MGVTVGQLILIPLRGVDLWIGDLGLRTNADQGDVLSETKLLNAATHTRVNDDSASSESGSSNSSHGLSGSLAVGAS